MFNVQAVHEATTQQKHHNGNSLGMAEKIAQLRVKLANPANQQLLLNTLLDRAEKRSLQGQQSPQNKNQGFPGFQSGAKQADKQTSYSREPTPKVYSAFPTNSTKRLGSDTSTHINMPTSNTHTSSTAVSSEIRQELAKDPALKDLTQRMVVLRRKLVYHQQRAGELAEGMARIQSDIHSYTRTAAMALLAPEPNAKRARVSPPPEDVQTRTISLEEPQTSEVLNNKAGDTSSIPVNLQAVAEKIEESIINLQSSGSIIPAEVLAGLNSILVRAPDVVSGDNSKVAAEILVEISQLLENVDGRDTVNASTGSANTQA